MYAQLLAEVLSAAEVCPGRTTHSLKAPRRSHFGSYTPLHDDMVLHAASAADSEEY